MRSTNLKRCACRLVVILAFSLMVFAQERGRGDDAALRELVERYFAAYASGDLAAYDALWSVDAPGRLARRRAMEALLSVGRYSFSPPRILRLAIDGDRARLWVAATRTLERGSGSFVTRIALALGVAREGEAWRIVSEGSAVAELGELLAKAESEAEREKLLEEGREIATRELVMLLSSQAERHYQSRDYARALDLFNLILRIATLPGDQASAWRGIGNIRYMKTEYPAAIDAYRKALALEAGLDRKLEQGNLWTSIALSEAALGNLSAAIAAYEKCLELSEEMEDRGGAASALGEIARLHREAGRYADSAAAYRRVVALREALRDRKGMAGALLELAEVEYDQGASAAALEAYLRAVPLLDDRTLVPTLHNIANLYYLEGRYDLALASYEREREAAARTRNVLGEAAALTGIGLVQTLYGDYLAALASYQKNLSLIEGLGEMKELPAAHQRVGGAHYALGDYARALEHYRKELELRRAQGDRAEIAWALLDVCHAETALGETAAALASGEESLKIFAGLKDQIGVGTALLHLAGAHFKAEDFARAREQAGRAAETARAAGDVEVYWQALHRAGKAHFRLKEYAPARQSFTAAIAALEGQRGSGGGDGRPQRALENRFAPYLWMVDLAVEQERTGEAFAFAERAKLRTLRWLLRSGRARITRTMTAAEAARETELARQVATLYTRLARARERRQPSAVQADLSAQLERARLAAAQFEARLYRLRPQLRAYRGDGAAISLDQAGTLLTAPRAALLEYVETEEQVYLFLLARGARQAAPVRLQAYALGVARSDLIEPVVELWNLLTSRGEGWEEAAQRLYDLLLKPAEEELNGQEQLLIVPDGLLWNVPFAALQTAEGRFLIESHALSFAPSLTALRLGRSHRPSGARSMLSVVAFGNPSLSPATADRVKLARRAGELPLRPETAREAEEIGRLYPAARVFTGAEARADRLRSEAANARILHLAVPVTISEASPFYSQAALSAAPDDPQGNGIFEARELLDMELRAELMILSSAEVAPRGLGAGKGLSGLGWTMAVAGCQAAIASQWSVEGAIASDLVLGFHRQWMKAGGKARAWQAAVSELIGGGEHRHPFYWAGTVILGDGL